MKIFAVEVSQKTVDFLERISYELEGQKRVIKELINENQNNPDFLQNKAFIAFNARYEEKTAEYEIAKKEAQETYIPEEFERELTSWEIDFRNCTMTIKYNGDKFDNYTDKEIEDLFNGEKAEKV